jgi:cellulose synthase/poly-beta-1,6-N-acetylglucosamine synthase-like glycosyltransferase
VNCVDALWTIIAIVLLPFAVLLMLPLLSDLCSLGTLAMSLFAPRREARSAAPRQRLLVLVAAHNEELLISDAVRSMVAMNRRDCEYDLVVISDNSTDRTAELAAAAGARVLERFDPERRGKPLALQWAMRQLPLADYDAVVIVDADTIVDPDFVDAFARCGPLRGKAVQSYSAISNEGDSWLTQLGALLVSMRYDGQYALKRRVGLNCPLGNGWCVGTDLLATAGWAPESLTETWELYARYTAAGAQVDFAPDSIMRGQEAHTLAQGATQRRRWQAGKLVVFKQYWSPILTSRRIGARQKLDALGELAAPGPVLHASLAAPLAVALASSRVGLAHDVAALLLLSLVPTVVWTLAAWRRHPQRVRLLMALAHIPVYAVWRLGIGVQAFATARRGLWQRSPRHLSA